MMYAIGLVLLALGILISVALHECGHMWVARATGMKVRRYFVGFGPTLWSTKRANKLGHTEYGIKAVPLGGFCDIAGMTAVDELAPEDAPYAMYRQKPWKRVAVLVAGPAMNFLVGLVVLYGIANVWGLPNLAAPTTPVVYKTACVAPDVAPGKQGTCDGVGPAAQAGIQSNDVIVKVDDKAVNSPDEVVKATQSARGRIPVEIERAGVSRTVFVDLQQTVRYADKDAKKPTTVGAMGINATEIRVPPTQYGPVSAVPATLAFTGELAVKLGESLAKIPVKMGALVRSLTGAERDPETPISVVGASRLGGEAVQHDLWVIFWLLLAQLNFVLGAINLLPLLPFDGGHVAVTIYEKIRDTVRRSRGLLPAGPVDYLRLMPAVYAMIAVLGIFTVLTVSADLINPITLYK